MTKPLMLSNITAPEFELGVFMKWWNDLGEWNKFTLDVRNVKIFENLKIFENHKNVEILENFMMFWVLHFVEFFFRHSGDFFIRIVFYVIPIVSLEYQESI